MNADEIVTAGAMALYRVENAHRVEEYAKTGDDAGLARDFEQYRGRYVRKFEDLRRSLAAAGFAVTRAA